MVRMERRYKLWWSGKDGFGGVGVTVEDMCEVVEARRVSDRVITVVLVLEEDLMRLICGCAPQNHRCLKENSIFIS